MADHTHIEWTDATWNIVTGCSVVSPGCTNCYAMRLAGGRMQHHPSRVGLTTDSKAGPVWNGQVRFNEPWLTQPLQWKKPRKIFVAAHGDLFHDGVTDAQLDQIFAVMALCPQHVFQILTKRSARMRAYIEALQPAFEQRIWATGMFEWSNDLRWPLDNVWLGVSVEDQARADERIPDLLATPAAVRWISAEPLLGPIDLYEAWHGESAIDAECWGECGWCDQGHPPLHDCQKGRQSSEAFDRGRSGLDWVVVGGESGPGARPMHPDWARELRDQCAEADVPFLFKQWGAWALDDGPADDGTDPVMEGAQCAAWRNGAWVYADSGYAMPLQGRDQPWLYRLGKGRAGRHLDGVLHDGYPS